MNRCFRVSSLMVTALFSCLVMAGAALAQFSDGKVIAQQKISATQGNFTGALNAVDRFRVVAPLGDLDGDGVEDVAVGAYGDDDGGTDRGAVWILFLNANGTVKSHQKISDTQGNFTGVLDNFDIFGIGVTALGDLDNDGINDLAVAASRDDDGGTDRGAIWILFMNTNGTVKSNQKISDTAGNFTGVLSNSDFLGEGLAGLGDLDGDGVEDLAVGANNDDDGGTDRGAVWILFLNSNGTVKSHQKISATEGNFTGILDNLDSFGEGVAALGDLDGDAIGDLAVGAVGDDDGGTDRGAVWILFMNTNGTVKSHQKISNTSGNFTGTLDNSDQLGRGTAGLGDLDGDGVEDLAVGAIFDDDGGTNQGAAWVLFLNSNGTVKSHQKISETTGGFTGVLDNDDDFGVTIANIGDLNDDSIADLAVGVLQDDDGGDGVGAVWILFMNSANLIANAGPDRTINFGQSVTIGGTPTANGGTVPYSYSWSPAEGLDNPNIANPTANPANATIYTVTVTDGNNVTEEDEVMVTVNGLASIQVLVDPKAAFLHTNSDSPTLPTIVDLAAEGFLPGDVLTLTYVIPPPGFGYTGCGGPFLDAASTTVLGIFSGSSTLLSTSVLARVPDAIDAGADFVSSPTFFGNQPTDIPEDFRITPPGGFTIVIPAGATHLLLGMHDSLYLDNCGTIIVTLSKCTLTATVSGDASICAGGSATIFAALTGPAPWNLTWSDGFVQNGVASSPATRVVSPASTTTYTVISIYDASCTGTSFGSATVTVNPNPTANAGADLATTTGVSAKIGANPTGSGTGPFTYLWSPATGLSSTTVANPTATPSSTTTYTVTVTDANSCVGTDQVTVRAGDLVNSRIKSFIGPTNIYDPLLNQVRVDIAIKNISTAPIYGPLSAVFKTLTPGPPTITIPNANGGGNGLGCYYDYSNLLGPDNILSPGETSGYKLWIFQENVLPAVSFKFFANIVGDLDGIPKAAGDDQPLTLSFDLQHGGIQDNSGSTLAGSESEIPQVYALHQNHPNPFNPSTTIQFDLPEPSNVTLKIYNSVGQLVRTLVSGDYEAGTHKVIWNARNDRGEGVASGLYLAVFKAGAVQQVRRVVLMK